ncbi:MAG: hypothetical protein GX366_02475 [Epulopiscium sp.]|nr:hypothetical protein [Candidatus Epulonipiscium sp.]
MKNMDLIDIDLKRDAQAISNYIESYVESTYLKQIREQVQNYKEQYRQEPLMEVELLEAISPFIEKEESREKVSNLVKQITYSKMIETMLPNYKTAEVLYRKDENKIYSLKDYFNLIILILILYRIIIWAEK